MINPPFPGQQFTAKNKTNYLIDAIFPPLHDEAGGVFRVVSIGYNAFLNTGNQVITNIRMNILGNWEEVPNDIPGANYPNASSV